MRGGGAQRRYMSEVIKTLLLVRSRPLCTQGRRAYRVSTKETQGRSCGEVEVRQRTAPPWLGPSRIGELGPSAAVAAAVAATRERGTASPPRRLIEPACTRAAGPKRAVGEPHGHGQDAVSAVRLAGLPQIHHRPARLRHQYAPLLPDPLPHPNLHTSLSRPACILSRRFIPVHSDLPSRRRPKALSAAGGTRVVATGRPVTREAASAVPMRSIAADEGCGTWERQRATRSPGRRWWSPSSCTHRARTGSSTRWSKSSRTPSTGARPPPCDAQQHR